MTWSILGVNEWSATDITDGLPITGTKAWPTAGDTAGDVGFMLLGCRGNVSPSGAGLADWTLIDSFVSTDESTNGERSWYLYSHVRGSSNPGMIDPWLATSVGVIVVYRHSSATSFTFGTLTEQAITTSTTTPVLTGGLSSAGSDSLMVFGHASGRSALTSLSSATAPATGVTGGTEDSTTAPSTSAWYFRVARSTGSGNNTAVGFYDCVLNSGSTGDITGGWLNSKGALFGLSVIPAGGDTTGPTITGPGGSTGSTSSASVAEGTTAVHTFTANETVTWSLNGGADSARFSINSSTGALAFSSAPDYESPTDVGADNVYIVIVRATDTASNTTDQTVTVTVTNVDDTAPTLSSPTGVATSDTTANGTVSTNESGGTLYYLAHPNSTRTAAAVISDGESDAVSSSGLQSITFTGLTASTAYYGHYVHVDAAGNQSAVSSTASSFTTDAASLTITTDPLRDQDGVLLSATLIAKIAAVRLSDMVVVETWADETTDGSGVLELTGALTAVPHLLVTSASNGLAAGVKLYTPA